MRVAAGAIVAQLLEAFGIWIGAHVIRIYDAFTEQTFRNLYDLRGTSGDDQRSGKASEREIAEKRIQEICQRADLSSLRCSDPEAEKQMIKAIDTAKAAGDTVGGLFEVAALHVPVGLGSFSTWESRLDARISGYFMSIPAVKAVEIGIGSECAERLGSDVHDPIMREMSDSEENLKRQPSVAERTESKAGFSKKEIIHQSNRAGGIEGGISNGEPIVVRAAMKPIPTLTKPLPSVHLGTGEARSAHKERSDVCAVPAASVVGEAMLAMALGEAFCERYGGDSLDQMRRHFSADQEAL
jgi:chorismate synthase